MVQAAAAAAAAADCSEKDAYYPYARPRDRTLDRSAEKTARSDVRFMVRSRCGIPAYDPALEGFENISLPVSGFGASRVAKAAVLLVPLLWLF